MDNEKKKCFIDNAQFSFVMKVDNQIVIFNGHDCADYFANHYEALGYEVIRTETRKG